MKVLVIGGSYFLGRVFTMCASQNHELTLVNRGQYSMELFHVKEYHFDRHDKEAWKQLENQYYDVVVDFCAYQKDDIKTVIEHFKNHIQHYIYISTVDVYLRQTGQIQDESHPLENRHFQGDMGEYIYQKRLLEDELITSCKTYHIAYTSIRPGNIYGPFNYAPRESLLIKRVIEGHSLYHLSDAKAKFQMVYVKDVVDAILLVLENKLYNESFNVINDEFVDYDKINCILQSIKDIEIENHTIQEASQLQYPLPYPLFQNEQELYSGQKIETFGLKYTTLNEGLKKTYEAFLPVYQK